MMGALSDAVILMAGSGSRLRRGGETSPKPLVNLAGRPLISRNLETLVHAGIKTIHAVIGFESDVLRAGMAPAIPEGIHFNWIENRSWQKQNGISLLAAASSIKRPFVLTMGDHIFEPKMVDLLIQQADLNALNVAVDRKLDTIVDLDDAMKVKTDGERLIGIGKNLQDYDAIDTGLFVSSLDIFKYLEQVKHDGDCSLADGVRAMAADGKVRVIDIQDARWHDVDSAETLRRARELLAS
jgi:1L-myo-inositol 1-phosphate cytidylyltransferase